MVRSFLPRLFCLLTLAFYSTAATFASACEYLIKRHTGRDIPISQLFIFFNGRVMDHGRHFFDDGGVSRRHVVKGMRRFGICKEEIWPMKRHYLNKKPPVNVYTQAKRTTVSAHHIPLDITAIRTSLAQKIPAIIGIKIEDGVFNEASVNGGYLSIPDPENMEIVYTGTHAVLVVGYDDTSQQFIVRNSWGSHWVSSNQCSQRLFDSLLLREIKVISICPMTTC